MCRKMYKEIIIKKYMKNTQETRQLSMAIINKAMRLNTGYNSQTEITPDKTTYPITVLNTAETPWAQQVDAIEAPFAKEYDQEEYGANLALQVMGMREMELMVEAFGATLDNAEQDASPLLGKRFLDVGSGTGRIVLTLAELGGDVTGFDATYEYVAIIAQKLAQTSQMLGRTLSVELMQSLAETYPYAEQQNKFDGISCLFGVLNHVENWQEALTNMASSLKPGGNLVISMYGINEALVFQLSQANALGYAPSLIQRRAPGGILLGESTTVLPAKFPSSNEIVQTLKSAGLEVTTVVGMLRLAALFPKNPTQENILLFIDAVKQQDPKAAAYISQFSDPEELLAATYLWDEEKATQQQMIEQSAYVFFTARKPGR